MKKTLIEPAGQIRKEKVDSELRFSFKFFDASDSELCPRVFPDTYIHTLMERLKDLSSWTIQQFTQQRHKVLRNHQHKWEETSRPEGFKHLNAYLRSYPGWQFQLTANEHGRVHGIIIADTFYVIWLDRDHKLYP